MINIRTTDIKRTMNSRLRYSGLFHKQVLCNVFDWFVIHPYLNLIKLSVGEMEGNIEGDRRSRGGPTATAGS